MKINPLNLLLCLPIIMILAACRSYSTESPPIASPTKVEEPSTSETAPEPTGETAVPQESLPVGILLPFSGQFSWVGENALPVVTMIVDKVNDSGGIGGSRINLIQADSMGTVAAGIPAADKLIKEDGILALLGPTSLLFPEMEALILEQQLPIVSPTAGTIDLDRAGADYFYRTVPSDSLGGRIIARALADPDTYLAGADAQDVVLLIAQDPAFISFKQPVESGMAEFGADLAATVTYESSQNDYQSEIEQTLAAQPNMVILVGTPDDTALLMQTAAQNGYTGGWFVTQDQTNPEFIELVGRDLAEGIFGFEETADQNAAERNTAFEERFMAYAGAAPEIFSSSSFDAANVLFLAMTRAAMVDGQINRATIIENIPLVANPGDGKIEVGSFTEGKQALEAGHEIDYVGLNGPIDFDEYGNVTAPYAISQVQDGQWEMISLVEANTAQ